MFFRPTEPNMFWYVTLKRGIFGPRTAKHKTRPQRCSPNGINNPFSHGLTDRLPYIPYGSI